MCAVPYAPWDFFNLPPPPQWHELEPVRIYLPPSTPLGSEIVITAFWPSEIPNPIWSSFPEWNVPKAVSVLEALLAPPVKHYWVDSDYISPVMKVEKMTVVVTKERRKHLLWFELNKHNVTALHHDSELKRLSWWRHGDVGRALF